MVVDINDAWAVALSSTTWLAVSVVVGAWAARWPLSRVSGTGPLTTLRSWESGGTVWQRRLAVSRWKDRLPEAGAAFADGRSKRQVRSRATADLQHFRAETIRAERVHWLILGSTPVHLVWCRPTLAVCMVVFGVLFNAPFIVIQRYNRGRLDRLIDRRGG